MSVSVVVNSACLGEKAKAVKSSGGIVHGERAALLKNILLPRLVGDPLVDEVIVVGEFEDGDGYTYVPAPSVAFDCTDALHQRQAGFEASSGDIVMFLHDDHMPQADFFTVLRQFYGMKGWDVIVPSRYCLKEFRTVFLNNGAIDGYVMGHASVMTRSAVEAVPWSSVAKVFAWDVDHSNKLRAAGMAIEFSGVLMVEDMEARIGGQPWR